jgi:aldehyde:ferredoxin oxidoreductase
MLAEWLRRCSKAGIMTDESTGIPISKIGSLEFIETLVRKIALREGFGDILAHGLFQAAKLVGHESEYHIPVGIDQTGKYHVYGPKLFILTALLYATEPEQPINQLHEISFLIHSWLDWYNKTDDAFLSSDVIRAIARRFLGGQLAVDFSTYDGKALAAKIIQDREYTKECLVLCDMVWPISCVVHSKDHVGDPTLESQVFQTVTGKKMDENGLYRMGERVFNLQRAVLIREGHKGRQNDTLEESDFTVPIKFAPDNPECVMPGKGGKIISRKGAVVDRDQFERMKDEYYMLRGWDITSGLQTKTKLRELGLQDIAEKLESIRLIK